MCVKTNIYEMQIYMYIITILLINADCINTCVCPFLFLCPWDKIYMQYICVVKVAQTEKNVHRFVGLLQSKHCSRPDYRDNKIYNILIRHLTLQFIFGNVFIFSINQISSRLCLWTSTWVSCSFHCFASFSW